MAYIKIIHIGDADFPVNDIIDNDAKVRWERSDVGLMHEKSLDGSYIFYKSMNEALYDAIMALNDYGGGYIKVYENSVDPLNLVVTSRFTRRDIEYDLDRCTLKIKPKYYDATGFKKLIEKDFNIITTEIARHPINYSTVYNFEFITCSWNDREDTYDRYEFSGGKWRSTDYELFNLYPADKLFCPTGENVADPYVQPNGWTFYSQVRYNVGTSGGHYVFDIHTTWFREIKLVPKIKDPTHATPPPKGASSFVFTFLEEVSINGSIYNKWIRSVDNISFIDITTQDNNTIDGFTFSLSDYYGLSESSRQLTRARWLIDVLDWFRGNLGLTTLVSDFFTNAVNPISGKDLRLTAIMQKTDAMFVDGLERSDPATNGNITFKALMEQLWAMFQVTYFVDGDTLYIEHIDFFRNNMSYTVNNSVGIDLTTAYPKAVDGMNKYSYEGEIPLREKFAFMESWNLDFIGADIDYTEAIDDGDSVEITADLITTDIDATYIDTASNEGFILFDVLDHPIGTGPIVHNYKVVAETGKLSGMSIVNGHFSWANLHHYYYKTNRPMDSGIMNNVPTLFTKIQKRKRQIPIEFPYCLSGVDDIINNLITTHLGDGQITGAEYLFKNGTLKLDLNYD